MSLKTKLYKNITDKLNHLPNVDVSAVVISLKKNGIVILGGEVSDYNTKCFVEKTIKEIIGVKGVVEELKVNIATPYARNDLYILEDALAILKSNSNVYYDEIEIVVENDALILSGYVDNLQQKECIEKAVQNIVGLVGVINDIEIKQKDVQKIKNKLY